MLTHSSLFAEQPNSLGGKSQKKRVEDGIAGIVRSSNFRLCLSEKIRIV